MDNYESEVPSPEAAKIESPQDRQKAREDVLANLFNKAPEPESLEAENNIDNILESVLASARSGDLTTSVQEEPFSERQILNRILAARNLEGNGDAHPAMRLPRSGGLREQLAPLVDPSVHPASLVGRYGNLLEATAREKLESLNDEPQNEESGPELNDLAEPNDFFKYEPETETSLNEELEASVLKLEQIIEESALGTEHAVRILGEANEKVEFWRSRAYNLLPELSQEEARSLLQGLFDDAESLVGALGKSSSSLEDSVFDVRKTSDIIKEIDTENKISSVPQALETTTDAIRLVYDQNNEHATIISDLARDVGDIKEMSFYTGEVNKEQLAEALLTAYRKLDQAYALDVGNEALEKLNEAREIIQNTKNELIAG